MSLVHGGSGFPTISPSIYKYISGTKLDDIEISINEVCDEEVKLLIKKVHLK